MASYVYNAVGSAVGTLPTAIRKNDTLQFNATNVDVNTRYTGTMLTYTFPFDCTVQLDVAGARGGKGNKCSDSQVGKGALLQCTRSFKQGDILLMCVGQAGTDFVGGVADGTSGAGGGGTFIAIKTTSGDTFKGSGVGNGWRIKPLIISAGGNGGRDIGYSGNGSVYHGIASVGSIRTYQGYSGGGYSGNHSNASAGKSFLSGASGATENFERSGYSIAGFGCGGGNKDDGEGGGGGGYYGGTTTMSATSYISSDTTLIKGTDGANFGHGYIIITFLDAPASLNMVCKINGVIKNVDTVYVKVNGSWREVSEVMFKSNGAWNTA